MSCTFCAIAAGQTPAAIAFADDHHIAFLDHRPLFHGHVLVVPRGHVKTLADLAPELVSPLFALVRRLSRAVERALEAEGSFVAINNRVSQSVPHLHVHVVPRRKGDGLKGFFWPRTKYRDAAEMAEIAAQIRAHLD